MTRERERERRHKAAGVQVEVRFLVLGTTGRLLLLFNWIS